MLVLERKHKSVKKHMKDRLQSVSHERGVVEDLVLDQLAALQEGGASGMISGHAPNTVAEAADLERLQGNLVGQVASE